MLVCYVMASCFYILFSFFSVWDFLLYSSSSSILSYYDLVCLVDLVIDEGCSISCTFCASTLYAVYYVFYSTKLMIST